HPSPVLTEDERGRVTWRSMELREGESVRTALEGTWDSVVHLAAVASGADARRDPGLAWETNAAGSARVAEELGSAGPAREGPLLLFTSTAEVYGEGSGTPRRETDPL